MISLIKHTLKALIYGIAGGLVVLVIIFVMFLESRPELNVWHQIKLDAEFTADSPVQSFEDYLALEKQLFVQLDERVFTRISTEDRNLTNRYHRGSLSDPGHWSPNWNRTFELSTDAPKAGVLLLHGMSDSPYSLRSLDRRLHSAGAWVIGLRLPGHGTAPSGLLQVKWEDMAAAVRLAMRHLSTKVGGRPLYLVGYSNASEDSRDIVVLQKKPGDSKITRKPLDMKWPVNIYSLSHVALPFPVNDPLYGMIDSNDRSKIQLGNMDLRGERGVLQIPAAYMLRLRWNPFYPYIERRLLEFVPLFIKSYT